MEASALQAPAGVARSRISIGAPLLRLRSDEQLVALFRAGNDDAFRVIHDRYRQRLFAYARQMLPGSRQDAEDALQDVFVRAYSSLRANDRDVALRAWLYRVAHNRCIDELRRPPVPVPELIELVRAPINDPIAEAEQRESLRRLIEDVRRLPEQQRSALLMRELSGMSYAELAAALGISVPAVKSLLVRARVGLAQAMEARETSCSAIRDELIVAHDRRVRPNANARRHLRDCAGCRAFRSDMRSVSRQLAALTPTLGPIGLLANLLGIGGGAGGSAAGGAAAASGAAGTGGAFAAGGVLATGAAGHVATLLAAAVVTAGGAVEIQHSISAPAKHRTHHHATAAVRTAPASSAAVTPAGSVAVDTGSQYSSPAAIQPPASAAPAKPAERVAPRQTQQPSKRSSQTAQDTAAGAPSTGGGAVSASDPSATATGDGATTGTMPTQGQPSSGAISGTGAIPPTTTGGSTSSSSTSGTSSSTGTSATGSGTASGTSGSSTGTPTSSGTSSTGTSSTTGSTSVASNGSVGLTH